MKELSLVPFNNQTEFQVKVRLAIYQAQLSITYIVSGPIENIVLPDQSAAPGQKSDLWQNTCFELFILGEEGSYHEFNISPSLDWDHLYFSSYRERSNNDIFLKPEFSISISDEIRLSSIIELDALKNFSQKLNIATIIKTVDSETDYFSLEHLKDKPDFHWPEHFVLNLNEI